MADLFLWCSDQEAGFENPAARGKIGKRAGAMGLLINILLFAAKLAAGIIAGSVAVIADAFNNLSDAASSVVTLLGFRLAQRPADRDHPYGHARYEYISGLLVAVLVVLLATELIRSSVQKILHPQTVALSLLTVLILLSSILLKLWMGHVYGRLGKKLQSPVLQAAAVDSRSDVIATAAVLAGSIAGQFWPIDGWLGLAVALFILWSGVRVVQQTISPLLGKRADTDLIEQIGALVCSHEGIIGIHDLLVHDYGPGQCFASLHAEMNSAEEPLICHDIIDDIECEALEKLGVHLVIHYDPVVTDDAESAEMRCTVNAIIGAIDPRLSMHDFRLVRGARHKKLVFDLAVPYDRSLQPTDIKKRIDLALQQMHKEYKTVIRFDGEI